MLSRRRLEKMVRENDLFLRGLDQGVVIKKELFHEISASDDEEVIDELIESSEHTEPVPPTMCEPYAET